MKSSVKKLIAAILVMVFAFSTMSCKSKKVNKEGATTTTDESALTTAMEKDGISDDDVRTKFLYKENGTYRINISTSPVVYWGYKEYIGTTILNNVMEYIDTYFQNPKNELPIAPVFKYQTNSKYYLTEEYNSISDYNLSRMGVKMDSDYAGRVHPTYEKDRFGNKMKDKIKTFQIELPKNTSYDDNEERWKWIVLHELGHGFGLQDIYDNQLKQETIMYWCMDGYVPYVSPKYFTIDVRALNLLYKH